MSDSNLYSKFNKAINEVSDKSHWSNQHPYGVYTKDDDFLFICKTEELAKAEVKRLTDEHGEGFYYKKED